MDSNFCTCDCSFMQLDLGQLQVRNEFSWHGSPEKDPSAVHLDVLDAEVLIFVSRGAQVLTSTG